MSSSRSGSAATTTKAFSITAFTRDELKLTLDKQKAAPSRRSSSSRRDGNEQNQDKPKPEKPRRGADTEVLDPWD